MNKKKVQALAVAGLLTIGVIGGTLAWFTSQDSVTNIFNTGSTDNPSNPDAGIDITENFPGAEEDKVTGDMVYKKPVLPGDELTKEVSVTSKADYDQFLRAKITKAWKISGDQAGAAGVPALTKGTKVSHYQVTSDGKVVYSATGTEGSGAWTELDYSKIGLNLNRPGNSQGDTWTEAKGGVTSPAQGYYYYNDILKGSKTPGGPGKTSDLLKTVTFIAGNTSIDNVYKNLSFDVKIDAEGIQASNGAAQDSNWDMTVPAANITGYKTVVK